MDSPDDEPKSLIYNPITQQNEQRCTYGVKFCQDTFLLESFLIYNKIPYKESDLERTPLGMALRFKKP